MESCVANVEGIGDVAMEADYLPAVVACENGNADKEALKAQAVATRAYLYYTIEQNGEIKDGQANQVYTCNNPPEQKHYDAVAATTGEILMYQNTRVAAFYVAGARQAPPACLGGTDEDFDTERFVTYNEGVSGDELTQTSLGFIDPNNYANRGCMSQNGADCLSEAGVSYREILKFYYGEDIERVITTECP